MKPCVQREDLTSGSAVLSLLEPTEIPQFDIYVPTYINTIFL